MSNILVLGPIFIPFFCAALCLVLAQRKQLQRIIAMTSAILAWVTSIAVLYANWQTGEPQVYRLGGWPAPFGITLVADMLSALFGVMATTVLAAGITYAMGCQDKAIKFPAFFPLFLSMATGLLGTFYTGDIFTMFVFLELMVIASVVLVAISDNPLGVEAAIKYLFISSMGTLFLLIGIAAIYTTFGTLSIADIARLLETEGRPLLALASAAMLMCAFLVKSAVFPFHFWQPDFHTTAPTPVHAVLSSVVVKVGVYGLIRLTTLMFIEEAALIQQLLIVLGIIGIFFGSLGALQTYDAKRLLAYSTFGQIGFILVGIGWGTPLALIGAVIYAVNHSFIKAALLMITGTISSRTNPKTARLTQIGGVGYKWRYTSILYLVGGLALAGAPPLNGFISKVALVQGGIDARGWIALALVVSAGLLTFLYMTRTWQLIFQRPHDKENSAKVKEYGDSQLAPSLLILLCVILGLYAGPLVDLATLTVEQLSDPSIYISAVLNL